MDTVYLNYIIVKTIALSDWQTPYMLRKIKFTVTSIVYSTL